MRYLLESHVGVHALEDANTAALVLVDYFCCECLLVMERFSCMNVSWCMDLYRSWFVLFDVCCHLLFTLPFFVKVFCFVLLR